VLKTAYYNRNLALQAILLYQQFTFEDERFRLVGFQSFE